ncbi:effector-associated constant component EACC1 [Haloactinospora alba]|uniref:effector-associated constant component EACC1 n=1 Tax=Haloactinospora alba TaxID=405555 RepID=UPI0037422F55
MRPIPTERLTGDASGGAGGGGGVTETLVTAAAAAGGPTALAGAFIAWIRNRRSDMRLKITR